MVFWRRKRALALALRVLRRKRERERRQRDLMARRLREEEGENDGVGEEEEERMQAREIQVARPRRRRRMWVHPLFQIRKQQGDGYHLYLELRRDEARFHLEYRMSIQQFDFLLGRVTPVIQRQDTFWREAIPPAHRLAICLR